MQRLVNCAGLISRLPANSHQSRLLASKASDLSVAQQRQDLQELNDFYPEITKSINDITKIIDVVSEREWIQKVVDYNVSKVGWPCALNAFNTMRVLNPERTADVRKAKYLAWSIELVSKHQFI
ncbi:hypothetical protein ONE63_008116 [Megalurothrips usitatus]|uniref:Uncharacterized protein n=1 Tax=Megalurothrips usitatus TaxID=439358 RepID=A0AAV7XPA1_9NEOP|nr:hypothetical protein ONE63_008116 [Megalurothrips usitatus]